MPQWAQAYPGATIYLAPSALGEDLSGKLAEHASAQVPQPRAEWQVLNPDGKVGCPYSPTLPVHLELSLAPYNAVRVATWPCAVPASRGRRPAEHE